MNLNQVTLPVTDVQAAVDFYVGMGFTLIVLALPRYARFECPQGDSTFSVHQADAPALAAGPVVYFECADVDREVQQLSQAGYAFDSMPTDEPWRWREARLRDPAGNRLCLYSAGHNRKHPPWRVGTAAPAR